jgi:cephalosporin hydroxylase
VITVDICETEEARTVLGSHRLGSFVQERLIGSSLDTEVLACVEAAVATARGPVLIFLDDWHDGDHVLAELKAFAPFVGVDGMLVVADTSFADLAGTPVAPFRSLLDSNPRTAIEKFLASTTEFVRTTDYIQPGLSNFADGLLRRCHFA